MPAKPKPRLNADRKDRRTISIRRSTWAALKKLAETGEFDSTEAYAAHRLDLHTMAVVSTIKRKKPLTIKF